MKEFLENPQEPYDELVRKITSSDYYTSDEYKKQVKKTKYFFRTYIGIIIALGLTAGISIYKAKKNFKEERIKYEKWKKEKINLSTEDIEIQGDTIFNQLKENFYNYRAFHDLDSVVNSRFDKEIYKVDSLQLKQANEILDEVQSKSPKEFNLMIKKAVLESLNINSSYIEHQNIFPYEYFYKLKNSTEEKKTLLKKEKEILLNKLKMSFDKINKKQVILTETDKSKKTETVNPSTISQENNKNKVNFKIDSYILSKKDNFFKEYVKAKKQYSYIYDEIEKLNEIIINKKLVINNIANKEKYNLNREKQNKINEIIKTMNSLSINKLEKNFKNFEKEYKQYGKAYILLKEFMSNSKAQMVFDTIKNKENVKKMIASFKKVSELESSSDKLIIKEYEDYYEQLQKKNELDRIHKIESIINPLKKKLEKKQKSYDYLVYEKYKEAMEKYNEFRKTAKNELSILNGDKDFPAINSFSEWKTKLLNNKITSEEINHLILLKLEEKAYNMSFEDIENLNKYEKIRKNITSNSNITAKECDSIVIKYVNEDKKEVKRQYLSEWNIRKNQIFTN